MIMSKFRMALGLAMFAFLCAYTLHLLRVGAARATTEAIGFSGYLVAAWYVCKLSPKWGWGQRKTFVFCFALVMAAIALIMLADRALGI